MLGKRSLLCPCGRWLMPGMSVWRAVIQRTALGSSITRQGLHSAPACRAAQGQEVTGSAAFNPSVLQFLVCPLSRKTLRYEESTNELINDELGIAYPIVDGIPNMIPQDARMIHKEPKSEESDNTQQ
ncbi:hypothetical protein GDO81_000808 [Engystomops pustulosus]|uniref:Protein preY, mitochondrial n=1 Tax=Engystomops pustulosus TaxID=76066 RepID=A0AAV7D7E9_ENGPU|nr:hypothetical protein GDO81_000808 [Engystomops pustulosus]